MKQKQQYKHKYQTPNPSPKWPHNKQSLTPRKQQTPTTFTIKIPLEQRTTKKPSPTRYPLPYSTYNSPQGNTSLPRLNDNTNTNFYKTKITTSHYLIQTRHQQNQNKLYFHPGTQHLYSPTNCMRCCF